jgi:hypothetical protein
MIRTYHQATRAIKVGLMAICLFVPSVFAVSPAAGRDSTAARPDTAGAPDSAPKPAYRIVTDGPVRLSAKLLPVRGKLTVGDPFELELTIRHPRDVRISEPMTEPGDDFLPLGRKTTTRTKGDTVIDVHRIRLAAFAPGKLALPPFLVTWQEPTEVQAAASETLHVEVASVMPKEMKDVNDLKPQVPFPDYLPLWILLGVVGAAGLALLGFWLYRRYRRIRLYGAPLPDPWTEANAALDAIPVDDWLAAGQVKRYYYTVSEILKRYIGRRFEFPALDQTTTEITYELKARKVPEREGFGDFFRSSDLVKYAKFVPPAADTANVMPVARELVKATTPAPEPAPAAAGEKPT